jgi:putative addiction module component (TIGR02574 family)
MNKALMAELQKLDAEERLSLAYDLLDSVVEAEAARPTTEAKRAELRRRLADYRAYPEEPVVTLTDNSPRVRRDLIRGDPCCVAFSLGSSTWRSLSAFLCSPA